MIYIILLGYVLPLIITALIHYFDKATETVGDFFKYWWIIFIPFINLFVAVVYPLWALCEKVNESNWVENFLNKKLWK